MIGRSTGGVPGSAPVPPVAPVTSRPALGRAGDRDDAPLIRPGPGRWSIDPVGAGLDQGRRGDARAARDTRWIRKKYKRLRPFKEALGAGNASSASTLGYSPTGNGA
jgi:hypothetical protein